MKVKPFVENKNFLLFVSAIALIAVVSMAFVTYDQNMRIKALDKVTESLRMQSDKDDIDSIEKDTKQTELENLDKEMKEIEVEINSTN